MDGVISAEETGGGQGTLKMRLRPEKGVKEEEEDARVTSVMESSRLRVDLLSPFSFIRGTEAQRAQDFLEVTLLAAVLGLCQDHLIAGLQEGSGSAAAFS
ncbi:hypothetical protein U0070_007390 [Myodes glareolus]|uniref:Uncharacterized protein n=1 Tax=Myodes glareolus TaxID=447135 RepID=A0AAW0HY96_MYOGA